MSKKETDIYLGGGSNINVRTASIVSVNNSLKLITPNDGAISLDIKLNSRRLNEIMKANLANYSLFSKLFTG
jgi:hypothetical protein